MKTRHMEMNAFMPWVHIFYSNFNVPSKFDFGNQIYRARYLFLLSTSTLPGIDVGEYMFEQVQVSHWDKF